jgi:hypothetical protein
LKLTNEINGSAMVAKGNKNLLKIAKTGVFELKGHCSTN